MTVPGDLRRAFTRPLRLVDDLPATPKAEANPGAPERTSIPPRWGTSSTQPAVEPVPTYTPRRQALRLPAMRRARNIIAGLIGVMTLEVWQDGQQIKPGTEDVTARFLSRPQRDRTLAWLLTWTVEDLMFDGIAYWRIVERRPGLPLVPAAVQRVEPGTITVQGDGYMIAGQRVPAEDVIAFVSTLSPLTTDAALTVLTATALELAAWKYAKAPLPQVVLKNTGMELDDAEQAELIENYETSRARSATAFLNAAVDFDTVGWSARDLQLIEARQHAAADVARLVNLDTHWMDVPSGGSSLTYQTLQDLRRDLVDITLQPYMQTIGQTLSVDNAHAGVGYQLCTLGKDLVLNPRTFLQVSDLNRAALWEQLIRAGVLTPDEARGLEPLAPKARTDA